MCRDRADDVKGYPMAKNLRAKIPEGDTMTIFDVNTSSTEKLKSEAGSSKLEIAKSPREVAEKSVSLAEKNSIRKT